MDQIGLLFMGGMLLVMWLFFIRPQAKQAKLAKEFQASIEKGTKVVTSGGIHGKIVKADDTTVMLEIDSNVKMRIEKSGISMELTKAAYGEGEKKVEVAEYLLERGLNPDRVSYVGLGSSVPIQPNDSPEGRRKNRRVEILIRWKN